jgi:hypothetical protein
MALFPPEIAVDVILGLQAETLALGRCPVCRVQPELNGVSDDGDLILTVPHFQQCFVHDAALERTLLVALNPALEVVKIVNVERAVFFPVRVRLGSPGLMLRPGPDGLRGKLRTVDPWTFEYCERGWA